MGRVAVGGTPGAVGRVTLLLIKNKRRNVFFRALPSFLRSSLSLLPLYCAVNVNASMYPSSVLGAPFSSSLSSLLLLLLLLSSSFLLLLVLVVVVVAMSWWMWLFTVAITIVVFVSVVG